MGLATRRVHVLNRGWIGAARRGWGGGVLLLGALLLALTGCERVPVMFARTPVPEATITAAPPSYSGTITCVGSSVLAPLLETAGARFRQAYPLAHILVITTTSQSGLSAVQDGGADLGLSDVSARAFSGIDAEALHDYPVAGTVYALITHPALHVTNLTPEQIQRLYTGQVETWRELGGADQEVVIVSRPKGAGSRAIFRQAILHNVLEDDTIAVPQDTDQDVAAMVAARPGAIGYISLAAVRPDVQVVTLGGVEPTAANARLDRYPFWGIAHVYTKGPAGGLARAFIEFLLSADMQVEVFKAQRFIPAADLPAGNP
jgi:phosphate transport system substrate-binding protein